MKGLGIVSLRGQGIMDALKAGIENKGNPKVRSATTATCQHGIMPSQPSCKRNVIHPIASHRMQKFAPNWHGYCPEHLLPPCFQAREGALFAFECLVERLGRLFEPYVIQILPMLLVAFGDGDPGVREATDGASRAIMSQLSGQGTEGLLAL